MKQVIIHTDIMEALGMEMTTDLGILTTRISLGSLHALGYAVEPIGVMTRQRAYFRSPTVQVLQIGTIRFDLHFFRFDQRERASGGFPFNCV